MMIRLLLVDDHPAVLQGLRMRLELERDLVVAGGARDGQTAVELALAQSPDVIVLDLDMPGMDGLATAAALRALAPCAAIVILSIHGEMAARVRALAAGAIGFVEKTGGIEPLLEAIRQAAQGKARAADQC
jgi:DNA-binding NarL/FixJ family response regulator